MLIRLFFALGMAMSAVALSAQDKPAFGNYSPEPRYSDIHSSSQYVTLRDGVKLAVRVDRPAADGTLVEGRFPVIWHHTLSISQEMRDGTGGMISGLRAMPTLAQHGYVVVQVARRGNGQSFGVRRGYHDRNEAQDAYEITQWLAEQPWSDGKVGIYGCSNTGDAAMHAISVRPPALKAVFAGCFSWHKFDAFRRGGIFAQWGTGPARTIEDDMAIPPVDGDADKTLLRQAAEQHQLSTPLLKMWETLPFRDSWSAVVGSRFWYEGSAASYSDQIRRSGVALYVMGGWHDELRDQGMITFLNVPGSRVVMGPWVHCRNGDFPLLEEMHRFFDFHLKGIDTGIADDKAIHYFVMAGDKRKGEWKASDSWPVAGVSERTYYLGDGTLENQVVSQSQAAFTAVAEPACPGETIGAHSQPCHVKDAGVSFASAPLALDTEITGHPVIDLWISANSNDATVFAYLEDVSPEGEITVITEGRLKASVRQENDAPWKMPPGVPWHRAHEEDSQPLMPGEVVNMRFDFLPTAWVFKNGHRIQVTLTGSDYRQRLTDPDARPVGVTVYSGGKTPSQLALPVVAQ